MAPKILPDTRYLRECFQYNKRTGVLRWRKRPQKHFYDLRSYKIWNTKHAGHIAGVITEGRVQITLGNVRYKAHRIIWKFVVGKEPPLIIDHKNRNGSGNRFSNLRRATCAQNRWNNKGRKNHRHPKNVSPKRNGWQVRINANKKSYWVGWFRTLKEAEQAALKASHKLHKKFSHVHD